MKKFMLLSLLFLLPLTIFSKELKKVTLQLSWFDQFQFAGYYMAKKNGYYKDYGFDVEIKPYQLGLDVSSKVDKKEVDFAVGRQTLILERVAGKKLVALYALFQESPLVLLTKKESGINKIQDFKNKRIMTAIVDAGEVSIKSMMISKGLKIDDLNFIKHTHNIMDLVNDNTDVISAYLSKTPHDLEKLGIEYNVFSPIDYGFDMYSDFLFTHEDKIHDDLTSALSFKAASLKGWAYAYSNIEETAKYIYENINPQNLTLDALIYEGKVLKKLSNINVNKLGEIRPEKIQRIYDLYNVMGLTPKKIDLDRFVLYKNFAEVVNFTNKEKEYIYNKKEIKMCVIPEMKPFSFIEKGEYQGAIADYINIISNETNLIFRYVETENYAQGLSFIKDGKCEIIPSIQNTKTRQNYINFTEPYVELSVALVTKQEKGFIDDIAILKDKVIGIPKSFSYNKILRERYPNNNFIDLENIDEGLEKVNNNEIYGYVDILHPLLSKIRYDYLRDLKISAKLDFTIPISIGSIKNDQLLHDILNKSVKSVPIDEVDRIFQKWLNVEYKKEFDYDTLWKFAFVFLLILLAIAYKQRVLSKMNETLQSKVNEKTQQLKEINQNLEQRVKKEVQNNLKKDLLLNRQAKLASMGEMIQNIAHQWRQPLSVISTAASGLKMQKDLNGKVDDEFLVDTLDNIVYTSKHLSSTIDDFMHFFKPHNDESFFSLESMFLKTLNIFNHNIQNKNIKLIKNVDNIEIKGYERELMQILLNVLNNSKDALLGSKEEEKLIFINAKKQDDTIIIEIKDTAGGIDDDIIEKIFEPYFTTKHQYQGTGIGLYMCQEILSKHMDGEMDTINSTFEYDNKTYKGALTTIKFKID